MKHNIICHRGCLEDIYQENTIEGILNAFDQKYQGVEFDIHLTKDKQIVIFHDYKLNGQRIDSINFYDLNNPLPLLSTLLNAFSNKKNLGKFIINIELKSFHTTDILYDMLHRHPTLLSNIIVSSFWHTELLNLKDIKLMPIYRNTPLNLKHDLSILNTNIAAVYIECFKDVYLNNNDTNIEFMIYTLHSLQDVYNYPKLKSLDDDRLYFITNI